MAAANTRTKGDRIRAIADRLYMLAERWDIEPRKTSDRQALHDDTEIAAGDVRAVVRGRGFRG